jgi:hypothetical protein
MRNDLPSSGHSLRWPLVRRNGDAPGKRWSTRMAYLVDTIAPSGIAVAVTGYIMRNVSSSPKYGACS